MFGSKDKARREKEEQSRLRQLADAGAANAQRTAEVAAKPDEMTRRIMDKATALDDWESGKSGPINVRNMPGGGAQIGLYNDAIAAHDADRIGGRGGSMEGNVNPNFQAQLNTENQMDRDLMAKGALEGSVNQTLANKDAVMGNLSGMGEARNQFSAGLNEGANENAQRNYISWLTRPKPMSFLKQLLLKGMDTGGQLGSAAITAAAM